jgi:hypothetical protein
MGCPRDNPGRGADRDQTRGPGYSLRIEVRARHRPEVGHRVACTVRGDEVVARKRSPPVALGACHKYGLALLLLESYLAPLLFSLSTDSGTMPILSPGPPSSSAKFDLIVAAKCRASPVVDKNRSVSDFLYSCVEMIFGDMSLSCHGDSKPEWLSAALRQQVRVDPCVIHDSI